MFTKRPARADTAAQGAPSPGSNGPPRLSTSKPAQPRRVSGGTSIISADLTITGNLESTGEVQIEGEVQGDIRANRIVVGAEAIVTGALVADEIVIGGNVQGPIRGNKVTFGTGSHIEGDVYHRTLAVEQGAYFEGKSRRSDNPMAVQYDAYGRTAAG